MGSLFDGLDAFGIEDIENTDLFDEATETQGDDTVKVVGINEEDLLYDRTVRCPVCDTVFEARTVKQGMSIQEGTQVTLRPIYKNMDMIKYDVVLCEVCGYTALNRNFKKVSEKQVKAIREKISMKYISKKYPQVYDYNIALERYKMALYNDMVMGRTDINKAYLCLKASWVIESLINETSTPKELEAYKEMYQTFVTNALKGFSKNYNETVFPVFGMDQSTYQYLLGALSYEVKDMKATGFWLDKVVLSPVSSARIKIKARELKAKIDREKDA